METTQENVGKCEKMGLPITDSFAGFYSARDAERNKNVSKALSPAGRVQSVRWEETC